MKGDQRSAISYQPSGSKSKVQGSKFEIAFNLELSTFNPRLSFIVHRSSFPCNQMPI